jgi:hypothetical protein
VCRIVAVEHVGLYPSQRSLRAAPITVGRWLMDVLVDRVAGLDIGKAIVVACVKPCMLTRGGKGWQRRDYAAS